VASANFLRWFFPALFPFCIFLWNRSCIFLQSPLRPITSCSTCRLHLPPPRDSLPRLARPILPRLAFQRVVLKEYSRGFWSKAPHSLANVGPDNFANFEMRSCGVSGEKGALLLLCSPILFFASRAAHPFESRGCEGTLSVVILFKTSCASRFIRDGPAPGLILLKPRFLFSLLYSADIFDPVFEDCRSPHQPFSLRMQECFSAGRRSDSKACFGLETAFAALSRSSLCNCCTPGISICLSCVFFLQRFVDSLSI